MKDNLAARIVGIVGDHPGVSLVERADLPSRSARMGPVPHQLHSDVRALLESNYPQGLYVHQAEAIQAALDGHDVCLATSTASGKTLAFLAVAADLLKRQAASRVVALYPARALIQDQVEKWETFLGPLGLRCGVIDGSVRPELRGQILRNCRVVLMTPDVTHAWLMSHLTQREVAGFVSNLRLLVLDESHVYDGVFGTNMAYFLRRLESVTPPFRIICSTATIGAPDAFLERLTGRVPKVWGPEQDGAPAPPKTVIVARSVDEKSFENVASLLVRLTHSGSGPFLAFADSRKMVEQIVATTARMHAEDAGVEEPEIDGGAIDEDARLEADQGIYPYRAGYEAEDRKSIHESLRDGKLAGVVSTSALELGIDIGEINLVVLLTSPPSAKAFWQRIGRAGRRHSGVCVVIDDGGIIEDGAGGLDTYLKRALEPNWLYLENRYIQYANALCAAVELSQVASTDSSRFASLPPTFRRFLENELNPTENIPADLYALKQRGQSGPHLEFPIRSGIEREFQVTAPMGLRLGHMTHSQMMREAYPGAVYYYLAKPYRVYRLNFSRGELLAKREKRLTTRPIAQSMVFPDFQHGILALWTSALGFLAETEVQVSERVRGFVERRGSATSEHRYGPSSEYSHRDVNRFFQTTGVCWYFADRALLAEPIAQLIVDAFCGEHAVQSRDLGVGSFSSRNPPVGSDRCQGICIYDSTNGSLRLTQRLGEHFVAVLESAAALASARGELDSVRCLKRLALYATALRPAEWSAPGHAEPSADDWVSVVAPSPDYSPA